MMMLASTVSMRRIAIILNINLKTVARKLEFLAEQSRQKLNSQHENYTDITAIQFDELQTIEHTKLKPLSVAMAVSKEDRKILGFQVSCMPATGHLASISRKKYGRRPDCRRAGLLQLFQTLQGFLGDKITIRSDECCYYNSVVKTCFPKAIYHQFKGQKSTVSGQGELKKIYRDPLFSINHTFAMLRANINRLIRKTWCTTKKISRLVDHLSIYVWVHNSKLTAPL
ncbi:transposase [Candidatus Marinamargulisbacteria bacterium SCGC AG-439-L15]|nr:transposase [Candidatus Marinamargulisbacteria bacterium SCGC AG-439-L15]